MVTHLEWVDGLGDTDVWMDGAASRKVTEFAGEADATDASELKAYCPSGRTVSLATLHRRRAASGILATRARSSGEVTQ
jgi:hypothetical protein